jgi:hypothetical protein
MGGEASRAGLVEAPCSWGAPGAAWRVTQHRFWARGLVVAALATMTVGQVQAAGVPGQGTWETSHQGRDLDGNTANGFEAYYDTAQNITWLADANYAFASGYTSAANGGVDPYTNFGTNIIWTDGRMGWDAAKAWAANLTIHGVTGWRLPTMVDTGTPGCDWAFSGTDCAYNVSTSTSEMAHLFHVTLGNKSWLDSSGDQQPDYGLSNMGPFNNVQSNDYWSGVEYVPVVVDGWFFSTQHGFQDRVLKDAGMYAWAVHSGDIATVPEPSAGALALAGLGVSLWTHGRRQR